MKRNFSIMMSMTQIPSREIRVPNLMLPGMTCFAVSNGTTAVLVHEH